MPKSSAHSGTARSRQPKSSAPHTRGDLDYLQTRDLDYLKFHSEESLEWITELNSDSVFRLSGNFGQIMSQLRRHDIPGGQNLLDELWADIGALPVSFSSIKHLHYRYFYGAQAYADYLRGDLEGALNDLDLADQELTHAISPHPFLVIFALHTTDLLIQRARIARRQNQWTEVERHMQFLREMKLDQRPYLTLHSGEGIYQTTIRSFLLSLDLDSDHREAIRGLLGERLSAEESVDFTEGLLFSLPDQVIPYYRHLRAN